MGVQQQVLDHDVAVSALVSGLAIEFGRAAGEGLAERFLDAEAPDFHWSARVQERWLGAYESLDEEDFELDRVAILGWLKGAWFVAICVVDGNGQPHAMSGMRSFGSRCDAVMALSGVR
jgi:hypothetical protein